MHYHYGNFGPYVNAIQVFLRDNVGWHSMWHTALYEAIYLTSYYVTVCKCPNAEKKYILLLVKTYVYSVTLLQNE